MAAAGFYGALAGSFEVAGVFVVVAIDAQQFPGAAIRRVVVVIMITMMHGELLQVYAGELARAASANPRVLLERLFTVAEFALSAVALGGSDDLI